MRTTGMELWKTIDCHTDVSDGIKPIPISKGIAENGVLNIKNVTAQDMPQYTASRPP